MVRKRVILLGITLGLVVNQFMLWQCNKVISAPNYSYSNADNGYYERQSNEKQYSIRSNNERYNQQNYNSQNDDVARYNQNYTYVEPRPEWWEFCPIEYEHPVHYKVPLTNEQFNNNDWYKLKQEFEKYLSECDLMSTQNRNVCYKKLRHKFSYRVTNYVPTVEKWNQWQRNYERTRVIDSAINHGNTHIFMNY